MDSPDHPFSSLDKSDGCSAALERVSARAHGVRQNVVERVINRRLPEDGLLSGSLLQDWQEDLFLTDPHQHLADRLKLCKFAKDQ